MIISASVRTDIPAFYGAWFMNRVRAGHCLVQNPYSAQITRVGLRPQEVDGFVLWTKNLTPFAPHLPELAEVAPFMVNFTINGYPRALESRVVDAEQSITQARAVAHQWGPRAVVWRYDTIVFASVLGADADAWHQQNFARLAAALEGAADEVIISFATIYQKTRRNMDAAARAHGFLWEDPDDERKRALCAALVATAAQHGMRLSVCAQPAYVVDGAHAARCIDAARLSDLRGETIRAPQQGTRPDCACHRSRDVGAYDTCPHGCVYCYAVRRRSVALRRYQTHDPASPFLIAPEGAALPTAEDEPQQPRLL